jgi:hypothetical protein
MVGHMSPRSMGRRSCATPLRSAPPPTYPPAHQEAGLGQVRSDQIEKKRERSKKKHVYLRKQLSGQRLFTNHETSNRGETHPTKRAEEGGKRKEGGREEANYNRVEEALSVELPLRPISRSSGLASSSYFHLL